MKRIFIDVHGVLLDLMGALYFTDEIAAWGKYHPGEYDITKLIFYDCNLAERIRRVDFSLLTMTPWAKNILFHAVHIADRVHLVSRIPTEPFPTAMVIAGTIACIKKTFTDTDGKPLFAPIMHTGDRSIFCASGDILIDDCAENCTAWKDAGGKAIMIAQPWNAPVEGVVRLNPLALYFGSELKEALE